ncbi:UNVERIFIED_CONTAM: hypothetical protein FKN15_008246 [Acipenser sinensis]
MPADCSIVETHRQGAVENPALQLLLVCLLGRTTERGTDTGRMETSTDRHRGMETSTDRLRASALTKAAIAKSSNTETGAEATEPALTLNHRLTAQHRATKPHQQFKDTCTMSTVSCTEELWLLEDTCTMSTVSCTEELWLLEDTCTMSTVSCTEEL